MTKSILLAMTIGLVGCAEMNKSDAPGDSDAGQLISRDVLFGNPDRAQLRISNDGKQVSYLAPVDGVLNVFVAPVNDLAAAKVVTHDKKRGIRQYSWAYTNQHIIYTQDEGGNENWNIHVVDLTTNEDKNLTPNPKVAARISQTSEHFPDEILVGVNDRNPQFHDLHRINLKTGKDQLILENPGVIDGRAVAGFVADDNYIVRFAQTIGQDGGSTILKPAQPIDAAKAQGAARDVKWETFTSIGLEDVLTSGPVGFDKAGTTVYLRDSRERDTGALFAWNIQTGEKKLLAESSKADASDTLVHPTEKNIQAVAFTYEKKEWRILDPSIKPDLDYLKSVAPGEINITSRSLDDKMWTVTFLLDNGPARSYVYDRAKKKATFAFTNKKDWESLKLAKMHPVTVKSRDGMNLVCYYTTPLSADSDQDGKPDRPVPMVLSVHGGPWARDSWGVNPEHQWLANRGYAVLSVNYRGSTGFGKKFVNAGNMEWAGKMHDDLIDAVNWAVKEKIADPQKVAIMGTSYGGYATLVGLTYTPDTFACGVDVVGPSSLYTLIKSVPPYWKPQISQFRLRVGDESTDDGKKFLETRSPLHQVDKIKKPLLIGQGANDPRVKQAEADQIVKAMNEKSIPVTYVLYPDEGHGFARPPNRISFYAVAEAFLAKHLGGRFEPIGDDFKGSSIEVKNGAEQVPGLNDSLGNTKPAKVTSTDDQ